MSSSMRRGASVPAASQYVPFTQLQPAQHLSRQLCSSCIPYLLGTVSPDCPGLLPKSRSLAAHSAAAAAAVCASRVALRAH